MGSHGQGVFGPGNHGPPPHPPPPGAQHGEGAGLGRKIGIKIGHGEGLGLHFGSGNCLRTSSTVGLILGPFGPSGGSFLHLL